MSISVYSTVALDATEKWHPLPVPRSAMLTVVPGDGRTVGQLARVDPDKVYALAERAPSPELRAAARRVRAALVMTGVSHV